MRRKVLWAGLLALPLAVAGLVYGNGLSGKPQAAAGYVCPATGEVLPCPDCCPLSGGAAETAPAQAAKSKASDEGFVCPLTGETLTCQGCCPLNQAK